MPDEGWIKEKKLSQDGFLNLFIFTELLDIVKNAFGRDSPPFAELGRMFYWMPKLKNLSPWPLPFHLPNDPLELAKLAIKRITSVDALTEVKVFHSSDLPESTDKTWIVSGKASCGV